MKKTVFLLFFFHLFSDLSIAQVTGDYRSVATGTWATAANWETFTAGSWGPAAAAPTSAANVITIQSPFTITISASVTADQIVVDAGATLQTSGAATLTIANGTAGADITINGTFQESSSAAVVWAAGPSTWTMGATGRLIKTTNTSSNNWQNNYQGGIATIPATATWVIRRNTNVNIPVSTTAPASGSVYPNLIIENNFGGTWTMPAASSFSGASIYPTVKGTLDIGGTGTSTVDFLNSNTNASPALIMGSMIIRAGSTARNYGTGYEIQGDLTVAGTMNYDANDTRGITFSGGNNQTISGAGTLNIYNMTMNKSGGSLTLGRIITVDNSLNFLNGQVVSTSLYPLTINSAASVSNASSSSFVSGPVRYTGYSAFTFPIGKGSDYQPLGISAAVGVGSFWTETFDGSNCALGSGCDPSLVGWTSVSTGAEGGSANRFYVSCAENGNAAGACGTGCASSDQSLHIGNVSTSAAAFLFCPGGDCGASYDASGGTELTNKRAESPTIDCSGKSNISVTFNYIENGQGASDNATFWYYDGATWAQLDDMAKVTLCAGQGTWTNRIVALPASANNNANVKIGFLWVNNSDGFGSDPSFAVDDISLYTTTTVDFTAEYFYANPQTTFNNVLAPTLNHITTCEYWTLTRNAGIETKNVTLSFDANSCGITALSDLRVAHWDGAVWQDEGNTATSGSTAAGTVTSNVVTWFSPFTLSSISSENPLPIELLEFNAVYNGTEVDLKWKTATELNNDFFSVERSADGIEFNEILRQQGAGNSSYVIHYVDRDREPLSGLSYYRLRQTDFDGQTSLSQTVPVQIERTGFEVVSISNSKEQGMMDVLISCNGQCLLSFEMYDMTGKKVLALNENMKETQTKITVSTAALSEGIYMLKMSDGSKVISRKIKL